MTTKKTIADLLEELDRIKLKQRVLSEAIEYLSKFISTDSYSPQSGIASPVDQGIVPEDVIEEVRDDLEVLRIRLQADAAELTHHPVPGKKATTKKKKATTKKKKASRRAPPKRRNSSGKKT